MTVIERLLKERRIEHVPTDPKRAQKMLEDARRHLEAAVHVIEIDANGAYHLLYDAGRQAVAAHMLAGGLRPTNAPGAHAAVAEYAVEALEAEPSAYELNRMRRARNKSEYGTAYISARMVEADLAHARAIVAAVERDLG